MTKLEYANLHTPGRLLFLYTIDDEFMLFKKSWQIFQKVVWFYF